MRTVTDRADDNTHGVFFANRRDGHRRPILLGSRTKLSVCGRAGGPGKDNPGDEFVLVKGRFVVPDDQIFDRHSTHAVDTRDLCDCTGGDQHRRRVGGIVGVGEDTANRGYVAHPGTRHRGKGGRNTGPELPDRVLEFEPTVSDHGAYRKVPRHVQSLELPNVLQRDPVLALNETLARQDAEKGSTGHDGGFGIFGDETQGLVDGGGLLPGHGEDLFFR